MKRYILVVLILLGVLHATCIRNTDNTVNCDDSGLVWQDNSEANTTKITWQEAINYCEKLVLANKSDWRLPNYNELISIVDHSRHNPAIYPAFQYANTSSYYSSTAHSEDTSFIWAIKFEFGGNSKRAKFYRAYVRCVRGGE